MSSEDQLRLHIEAIETLESDKKEISDDIKDRYALAKSDGFDVKALRKVIRRRAIERAAVEEEDAIIQTYEAALV